MVTVYRDAVGVWCPDRFFKTNYNNQNDMNELEKIKAKQAQIEQAQSELNQLIKEFESNKGKEKGYTWEECFVRKGFYVDNDSLIAKEDMEEYPSSESHKNIATTKKVCESHLAACQLSHIIERLNKDFGGYEELTIGTATNDFNIIQFGYDRNGVWALPYLKSTKAANKLVETNTPLLKQYFGIDE